MSRPLEPDDRESWWVLRAQAGDREALERLLESIAGPLGAYLARLAGEAALGEDLLQEALLQIYRKLGWLEEPRLFRPWAFRLASRLAWKRLRRERRLAAPLEDNDSALELLAAPDTPEPGSSEVLAALPRLVAELSPASRSVLALHFQEEMTLTEVAGVLGIPEGTVKSRLAYGLARLRQQLGRGLSERSSG
ncbi:MAG TPA: RNA polymerase sigma factor [Thermoanaerobaculia bacterium]|nr:RNA polymerase sigma factor [Thermoanaerobaculia bacterium]